MTKHRFADISKTKKLGLILTIIAFISFLSSCAVVGYLILLGYPLEMYFTSQGTIAPSFSFDVAVAVNGLCGTMLIIEGLLLLSEKERIARVFLPLTFGLVVIPYLVSYYLFGGGVERVLINAIFYPSIVIGYVLLIFVARNFAKK